MNNNNNFENKKLDGFDTTKFCLRAEAPNNQERYSVVKLYVNDFDNSKEGGITIGYWTHNKNCEMFIPLSPSHWNLISETLYLKDVRYLPIQIGEEISYECELLTYFPGREEERATKSIRNLMNLPDIKESKKCCVAIDNDFECEIPMNDDYSDVTSDLTFKNRKK